jgi:ssDNA-binding Zn-finger/Zn-ribbon topoisomerase 1
VRELHAQKQAHQPTPEPKPEPQLAPQRDPAPTPKPAAPACPRCGGKLDDYTFKTGAKAGLAFRGCVRFPACDYRVELPAS